MYKKFYGIIEIFVLFYVGVIVGEESGNLNMIFCD